MWPPFILEPLEPYPPLAWLEYPKLFAEWPICIPEPLEPYPARAARIRRKSPPASAETTMDETVIAMAVIITVIFIVFAFLSGGSED